MPSSLLTDLESKTSLRCFGCLVPLEEAPFLPLGSVKRRMRTDGGGRDGELVGGVSALQLGSYS